jgi:hypothetical protein
LIVLDTVWYVLCTEKILMASHFHCFSHYHITVIFAVVAVPVVWQAELQCRACQSQRHPLAPPPPTAAAVAIAVQGGDVRGEEDGDAPDGRQPRRRLCHLCRRRCCRRQRLPPSSDAARASLDKNPFAQPPPTAAAVAVTVRGGGARGKEDGNAPDGGRPGRRLRHCHCRRCRRRRRLPPSSNAARASLDDAPLRHPRRPPPPSPSPSEGGRAGGGGWRRA